MSRKISIDLHIDTILSMNKTMNLPEICERLGISYRIAIRELSLKGIIPIRHAYNKNTAKNITLDDAIILRIAGELKSGESLRAICIRDHLNYMDFYKRIRRQFPDLINTKKTAAKRKRISESLLKDLPDEDIISMYRDEKKSSNDIAKIFKTTNNTILSRLKLHNIPLNDQSVYWTDDRKQHARNLANSGIIGVHRPGISNSYSFTKPERDFAIWCNSFGIEYVRQYQIKSKGHRYDFYIPSKKLLVEIDGVYWHQTEEQKNKDSKHTKDAISAGYQIVRFTDVDIQKSKMECFESINDVNL
jgi:Protein of unknown function (DUF559)